MAESLEGMVRKNVAALEYRMQANPNDYSALNEIFNISLSLKYGSNGYPQNGLLEKEVLEIAATHGHDRACYERARVEMGNPQRALYYVELGLSRNPGDQRLIGLKGALGGIQSQKEADKRQLMEAEHRFQTRDGLEDAIRAEIFPCVVSIVTNRGTTGSGFYQYSEWLMSNAHVVPSFEILAESSLLDFSSNQTPLLGANRAFYRPSNMSTSPDVVIINGNLRENGNNKCLPMNFSGDGDLGKRIVFYAFFNHETKKHQINYLKPYSNAGSFPMVYECEDGVEPRPGCSGSPVIAARLLVGGREVKWQFETVGVVYARCLSRDNKQLVCAIPVSQEFKQILETVLHPELHAERAGQMAYASTKVIDGTKKSAKYQSDSEVYAGLASRGLRKFEAGKTMLNIELPDGLEKLLGKDIIGLDGSAFLHKVQEKFKISDRKSIKGKSRTIEELSEDLYEFFETLKEFEKLPPIATRDQYLLSTKGYFRIDVGGGTNKKPFVFDIQDNIGDRGEHAPPPYENEPISSKFAIASILKKLDEITGVELAKLLIESLHPTSTKLLRGIAANKKTEKKERLLHMWRGFCYAHGKQPWKSEVCATEREASQELENKGHFVHQQYCAVKPADEDDSSSDELLYFEKPTSLPAKKRDKRKK